MSNGLLLAVNLVAFTLNSAVVIVDGDRISMGFAIWCGLVSAALIIVMLRRRSAPTWRT